MTNYSKHADLAADVAANRLSDADARIIASRRDATAARMECEFERVSGYERSVRNRFGSNVATKGKGHKTLGARQHGKAAKQARGAGYGDYRMERLYRNPTAL